MSIDRSLKTASGISSHRNVLTRAERIERLRKRGDFDPSTPPIGLPKIANRKVTTGKKVKKKGPASEESAA